MHEYSFPEWRLMNNGCKFTSFCVSALLFLSSFSHAERNCPIEIKLLLPPPTIQTVIASLGFEKEKETTGEVHFFDTDALDLLKQGLIVRIRQGAANDFTIKVRAPEGNKQADTSQLRKAFPCEIDRTGAGDNTSYSVRRKYKTHQLPETGNDIFSLLSPEQQKLLREAGVTVDWARVRRIANIKATDWESRAQPSFSKISLELWEWPESSILEISTKVAPDEGQSKYDELQQLLNSRSLQLSTSQGTKTKIVLETNKPPK